MEENKLDFDAFLATVADDQKEFVRELHALFLAHDCKIKVKEAKSGYVVSYTLNKKTIMNHVFRKAGVIARIYANHIIEYMELFETMPESMVKTVKAASDCKRLLNPDDCNPKYARGYDFILQGQRQQKCRYNTFEFLLCQKSNGFIKSFVEHELKACA